MDAIAANTLITRAGVTDPRSKPDTEKAKKWAELLWDVTFEEGLAALHEHQRESTETPRPAHILAIVRQHRRRLERAERVQRALYAASAPAPDRSQFEQPRCPRHPDRGVAQCLECLHTV